MIKKLLIPHSGHVGVEFVQYGFVAAAAFIVDFGLLYLFTHAGMFYLLSATFSFSISLVLNYFLSIKWVFSKSPLKRSREVTVFTLIGFVGLGLNLLIIWIFTSGLGVYYLYSKLIAVAIVFFWSFFARRYFIFRTPKDGNFHIPFSL